LSSKPLGLAIQLSRLGACKCNLVARQFKVACWTPSNSLCLEGRFDLKLWIYVSNDFDVVGVTRLALESVTQQPCNLHDLNTIQVELSEKLEGKKFLLVLDDIWSEKVKHWENLCDPFNTGAQGSKIIVTTRNEGVVDIMGVFPKVWLHKLKKEDGWSLLS
ncbi:hypothetical protein Ancab_022282, partial [Ancistrocladus abbreviatus]